MDRVRWYFDPMWWLVILLGIPAGLLVLLLIWAMVDRTPPLQYEALHAGSFDPAARVLTLQWQIHRNRYCPGELVRTIEGGIGGALSLPVVAIDPFVDSVDIRRARIGTSYVGRLNLIEIPKTVGGRIKVTSTLRLACNPMQYLLPIVLTSPPVFFDLPNPEDQVDGTQPVTVGPPPE